MINISTKKISAVMLAVSLVLSCATIILSLIFNKDNNENVNAEAKTAQKIEYILKDYNGHLAVFYSSEETPYEEFDILTNSFSDYDKNLLSQGISADTEDEIQQLIEDYTS